MTRIKSGMMLGLALAFAAGCGSSATPEQAQAPAGEPLKPVPGPDPKPADQPLTGELAGVPFNPAAEFQGDTLYFRSAKPDGTSDDRSIEIKLTAEQAKKLDGLKVTAAAKATDPPNPGLPEVLTVVPDRKPNPLSQADEFTLTLEFGAKAGRKLPGKITLALKADEKTRLSGSFVAEVTRPLTEPPGADDAPFVQGKVVVSGWAGEVKAGYVKLGADNPPVYDVAPIEFKTAGSALSTGTYKPRVTVLVAGDKDAPGRYEHVHLPPARYLVFVQAAAQHGGGPAAWKWVDVAAGGQVTLDFALDAGRYGGLEVTVPAGTDMPVQVVPAAEGAAWDEAAAATLALLLGLQADVKGTKAEFARLGPGKYEVRASGLMTATVEVKPGEAAKVELKK
jgi:hypothetical protein